jgi:hypothetical protein
MSDRTVATGSPKTRKQEVRGVKPDPLRSLAILLVVLWHLLKAATPDWLAQARLFG